MDAEKLAGSNGTTLFTFAITRSGSLNSSFTETVDFEITADGSLASQLTVDADDFGGIFPSGVISLPQGTRAYSFTVPIYKPFYKAMRLQ